MQLDVKQKQRLFYINYLKPLILQKATTCYVRHVELNNNFAAVCANIIFKYEYFILFVI